MGATDLGRVGEVARGIWSAGVEIPAARRGYDGKGGAGMTVVVATDLGRVWEAARSVWSAGVEIPAARRGYDGMGARVWRRWWRRI